VETNGARGLGLCGTGGLGWVDNSDTGSTTTLAVLDDGSTGAARRLLLAGRSIGHAVVELEVAVEFGGDLEFGHREAGDAGR
jgi:hypothetical protein